MDDWKPDPKVMDDLINQILNHAGIDCDKKGILIDKDYSANEIVEEIKKGTHIGRFLYNSHIQVMKDVAAYKKK